MRADFIFHALGALERYPLLDNRIKEIVGINTPKIALARSEAERVDVAISEIGNTVSFVVGGVTADRILAKAFTQAQKLPEKAVQHQWAVVGRSLGLYGVIFSMMWAMPFIRNYITAKRTGTVSFKDVIQSSGPAQKSPQVQQASLKEAMDGYRNKALTILGLGFGFAAGSAKLAHMAAHKKLAPEAINRLFKSPLQKLFLKGGKFANFGGWPALLFWGAPSYGGWLHAARDPYERKEQMLKFGNFVACFFGPSLLINKLSEDGFKRQFPKLKMAYADIMKSKLLSGADKQQALKLWARKNMLGLGSSILLLGTMPQALNIYLTKRRMQRDQKLTPAPAAVPIGSSGNQPALIVIGNGISANSVSTGMQRPSNRGGRSLPYIANPYAKPLLPLNGSARPYPDPALPGKSWSPMGF